VNVIFQTPAITWAPLTPIIIILGAAALGILLEAIVRTPATRRAIQLQLAILALLASAGVAIVQWVSLDNAGQDVLRSMLTVDRQAYMWQVIILLFGALGLSLFAARTSQGEEAFEALGASTPGSAEEAISRRAGFELTEVFPLGLFAVGGMMLFTTVTDFVFLFVALEVFSLPLYILVALARRRRLLSHEAALKYFLLGAFSSAFYLFGVALLYLGLAQSSFTGVALTLELNTRRDILVIAGAVMVLTGLFFKLGAAPFHSWTPDAYQGAPTPVTAFMAAATKAAATAALIRVVYMAFYPLEYELSWAFWAVAIASMVLGTVLALVQENVKRMLAYSSVAHAGFVLVAFAGFTPAALSALPFYLLAYGLATIGAFAVIMQVREVSAEGVVGSEAVRLGQWAGLGKRSGLLAGAMTVFLLSFAGIPLTAGFIGKFQAFAAAIDGGAWPLVLVAVLASAAAAFFYVRLIVLMYFTDAPEGAEDSVTVDPSPIATGVVVITAVLVLILGIVPGLVLSVAENAAVIYQGL
jgi:NADH-quinone oxidoreductase subunit N